MRGRGVGRQTELMVPGVKSPAGESMMMGGKVVRRGGMKKSRLVRRGGMNKSMRGGGAEC